MKKVSLSQVQLRRTEITIAIICAIIGFLLVTQVRGQMKASKDLTDLREQDLGEYIRDLNVGIDALRIEVTDLKIRLYTYEKELAGKRDILNEAVKNLERLKIFTGAVAVEGSGIVVEVRDNKSVLESYDLLDILEELRGSGAEVVSLDEIRICPRATITKKGEDIFVGDKRIRAPYIFKAVGDPEVLKQGLMLPGGVKDKLSSLEGVNFKVQEADRVIITTSYKKLMNEYAKPILR